MRNYVSKFSAALATAVVIAAGVARGLAVEPLLAQGNPNCAVLLDQTGATAPMAGGTFTVTVFPEPANCNFQVSVRPPERGEITKGPGNTANVTVFENPAGSAAREARFQIGDQVFRVVQAGESAATPWHVGDVFVGAGSPADSPGVYKTLAPQGTLKTDSGSNVVPDLLDGAGYFSSGCMVDPTAPSGSGHLFTASWKANTLSIFDGVTQQLRDVFSFTDPSTIHPYDDLHQDEVGVNTPLAALPRAAGVAPLPLAAIGVADNRTTPEDEFVTPEIQGFEQVVFANDGQFYVGTQKPPFDNALGLGHGYLLRFRYNPAAFDKLTLTGWWVLDAGAIANRSADRALYGDPIYADGTSNGDSGVDQFDLSSDQRTIFYTSEDSFIRSFDVITGDADKIQLQDEAGVPLPPHVSAFGLRILPGPLDAGGNATAADGSAGFLVATADNLHSNFVRRVDATGRTIMKYAVPGQPFALNLTPDAQYFWTADQMSGIVYRFHIASGAREPFNPGTSGVFGLCVKREYSAATANGQCVDLNADGSYGPGTSACRTPPVCLSRGIDSLGNQNPDCFPPGLTRPVYDDLENREGESRTLDINRTGFVVAVSGLQQIPGLSITDGVISGTISTDTCTPGFGEDPRALKECVFTLNVHWLVKSDYDAGAIDWQVSPFTWTIIHGNAAPELRNPGTITLEVGQILPTFVPAVCPIGSFMAILDCAGTPIAMDPDQATDFLHVFTAGLPPGLTLPSLISYGTGWHLPLGGTAPTTLGAGLGKFNVTITVCDDGGLLRNSAGAPIAPLACDPASSHTRTESFFINVNARPTLDSVAQLTQVPLVTPATYQLLAEDANGDPLTYELVSPTSPPAWLNWNASTHTFTATPTLASAGAFIPAITVRVTDALGAAAATTFSWRVNRAPVLAIPSLTFLVGTTTIHPVNATDSAGDTLTYALDSVTYSALPAGSTPWVSWTDTGTSRTLTAAPTAADAGSSATIKVRVSDGWGGTTIATALWFAITNSAPVCDAATVTPGRIWPPNHKLVPFFIDNVMDPDNDRVAITITSITQDQPVNDKGDGNTGSDADATGLGASSGAVRAERSGNLRVPGDGRLYFISFTATDGRGGRCDSAPDRPLTIAVPHDQGQRHLPTDNGCRWDSFSGRQIGLCAWLNAPVLTLANRTNYAGDTVSVQVTATDPDGTPLTYGATGLPPGLSMSSSGLITGTIEPGAAGKKSKKYKVTVSVNDDFGAVKRTFVWTVKKPGSGHGDDDGCGDEHHDGDHDEREHRRRR